MERLTDVETPKIANPKEAAIFIRTFLADSDKECMVVLSLNSQLMPLAVEVASIGTADKAFASIKDIFKHAIISNATGIIVGHNHPSGSLDPSAYDISVTKKIKEAGDILEIQVLDHIIVTEKYHSSMKDRGYFDTTKGE